jgi:hypothetical protein
MGIVYVAKNPFGGYSTVVNGIIQPNSTMVPGTNFGGNTYVLYNSATSTTTQGGVAGFVNSVASTVNTVANTVDSTLSGVLNSILNPVTGAVGSVVGDVTGGAGNVVKSVASGVGTDVQAVGTGTGSILSSISLPLIIVGGLAVFLLLKKK